MAARSSGPNSGTHRSSEPNTRRSPLQLRSLLSSLRFAVPTLSVAPPKHVVHITPMPDNEDDDEPTRVVHPVNCAVVARPDSKDFLADLLDTSGWTRICGEEIKVVPDAALDTFRQRRELSYRFRVDLEPVRLGPWRPSFALTSSHGTRSSPSARRLRASRRSISSSILSSSSRSSTETKAMTFLPRRSRTIRSPEYATRLTSSASSRRALVVLRCFGPDTSLAFAAGITRDTARTLTLPMPVWEHLSAASPPGEIRATPDSRIGALIFQPLHLEYARSRIGRSVPYV